MIDVEIFVPQKIAEMPIKNTATLPANWVVCQPVTHPVTRRTVLKSMLFLCGIILAPTLVSLACDSEASTVVDSPKRDKTAQNVLDFYSSEQVEFDSGYLKTGRSIEVCVDKSLGVTPNQDFLNSVFNFFESELFNSQAAKMKVDETKFTAYLEKNRTSKGTIVFVDKSKGIPPDVEKGFNNYLGRESWGGNGITMAESESFVTIILVDPGAKDSDRSITQTVMEEALNATVVADVGDAPFSESGINMSLLCADLIGATLAKAQLNKCNNMDYGSFINDLNNSLAGNGIDVDINNQSHHISCTAIGKNVFDNVPTGSIFK